MADHGDNGCVRQIREILDARKSPSRRDGIPSDVTARQLVALPPDCVHELRATADRLLGSSPDLDEGSLNVVLSALTELRDPSAPGTLVRALENPQVMQKEDYVSLLEYLDSSVEATAGLRTVLERGLDDLSRPDLGVTIRALHAVRAVEAAPLVARYVGHPDSPVRGVAMEFLFDMDDSGAVAGHEFVDQLRHEDDPARLEQIIDALVRWDRLPEESIVARLADDAAQPDSLRDSARRALAALRDSGGSGSAR